MKLLTSILALAMLSASTFAADGPIRHVVHFKFKADADKAQIYAGWREMHEYMVKQKLETIAPPPDPVAPPVAASGAHKSEASGSAAQPENKPHAQLTPEEADRAMRNDPQVAAVLAAIKRGGLPPAHESSRGRFSQRRHGLQRCHVPGGRHGRA